MSKAAQPSEPAPESFEQYQSLKSAAVTGAPPATEELVPASEPEEPPQEQKPPTDEDKAERKRRNDDRRERKWWEQRGQMRAEMQQMRDELDRLKSEKTQSPSREEDAEPTLKSFLESGKFPTYEAASEAHTKAVVKHALAQAESERQSRDAKSFERESKKIF